MKITIRQDEITFFDDAEIGEVFEQEDEVPCLKIDDFNCFNLKGGFICKVDYDAEITILDAELVIRK